MSKAINNKSLMHLAVFEYNNNKNEHTKQKIFIFFLTIEKLASIGFSHVCGTTECLAPDIAFNSKCNAMAQQSMNYNNGLAPQTIVLIAIRERSRPPSSGVNTQNNEENRRNRKSRQKHYDNTGQNEAARTNMRIQDAKAHQAHQADSVVGRLII